MKYLIHYPNDLTNDIIKKSPHFIIHTFIPWYRSLPFYIYIKPSLNQFILNNRLSKYLLFVLCYFLMKASRQQNFLSLNEYLQRIYIYQKQNSLPIISQDIIHEFRNFLIQLDQLQLTNIEFSLLNILLVIQHGKNK